MPGILTISTKKREGMRDSMEGRQKTEEREVLVGRIFS
jgi:hypothetical protein